MTMVKASALNRGTIVPDATSIADEHLSDVFICHCDPLISLGVASALRSTDRFHVNRIDPFQNAPPSGGHGTGAVFVCDFDTGLTLVEKAWGNRVSPRVVIVTPRDKEADVQLALSRGVLGYLLLGCQLQEVVDAVIAAGRGQRFLTASAAELVASQFGYQPLTQREVEVLTLVAMGRSNKMIANQLGVTEGTIKCHVKAILGKLGVRGRTEAANVAMRRGIVSEPMGFPAAGQGQGGRPAHLSRSLAAQVHTA
ncbi:DNA-binding response regulator [Aquabacterium soli]|uniref:DNA-binding response regulator n=1 Tax=Aquabacterium soli TaxID=2493092 RepID=A0A426VC24_9BURK|nr:response regulator transcription factor [Aquabacterium soli]RRS04420.1 DNA-binding response regulator [Aquabacterium soli]